MQLAISKLILSIAVSIAANWVALSSFEIFKQKSLFFPNSEDSELTGYNCAKFKSD